MSDEKLRAAEQRILSLPISAEDKRFLLTFAWRGYDNARMHEEFARVRAVVCKDCARLIEAELEK